MRKTARSIAFVVLALVSVITLAMSAMVTSVGFSLAATTTALIMGGTGRPDPADFPGYMENVESYYIVPNTTCGTADVCNPVSVFTPETAWPLYGGPDALTWRDSILQGVEDLDGVVQPLLPGLNTDNRLVIFGYSQSGAIVAFEKAALAGQLDPDKQQLIEFVIIGNVSRANGGLNGRANGFSIPIVDFPFGPTVPTDTDMPTTDIAMKWDIIADAPLYITNPIAMFNALLGFEYVHGTYPDPTQASPDSTPGGYTITQWQAIMDNPEGYAALNPGLVNVQTFGDTKFITVTPTVLPLVAPLHQIGLKPLADLIEPGLRALIEHTGYDRSIPYGQPTPFRFLPIFNPIALAVDLILAIPQGITNMVNGLQGKPTYPLVAPPADTTSAAAFSAPQSDPPVDKISSQDEKLVDESFSGSTQRTLTLVQDADTDVYTSTEPTTNETTEIGGTTEIEDATESAETETEETSKPDPTTKPGPTTKPDPTTKTDPMAEGNKVTPDTGDKARTGAKHDNNDKTYTDTDNNTGADDSQAAA